MIIGNLCKEMLSWRRVATLVPFLLLPIEAFDPDLKTPLDQYQYPICEAGGMSTDYDYYYDDQDQGNFDFLDKYIKELQEFGSLGIYMFGGNLRGSLKEEDCGGTSWINISGEYRGQPLEGASRGNQKREPFRGLQGVLTNRMQLWAILSHL